MRVYSNSLGSGNKPGWVFSNLWSKHMKQFIMLTSYFVVAIAPVVVADDALLNRPATPRIARPAANVRPPTVSARRGPGTAGPNVNARRNRLAFAQQLHRAPPAFALNPQARLRGEETQATIDRSQRREIRNTNRVTLQGPDNNRLSFVDALRRCRHERHDCNWWRQHFITIVFVNRAYYYFDAGYWFPAWGYDPLYNYYDYDGPIYTYGNLLPDQVIANVQSALREEGYYLGPVTGSLSATTRAAIANYQRDYGLDITGAIDEPTIESLGLN
jgi:hypothetical protein